VLQEHLETFLARVDGGEGGANWPGFVRRELRSFMECGRDGIVAFSCKGRGFCPSCGGRRMADRAAYLCDSVLPEVPYRQWVFTVPFRVRYTNG